MTTVEQDIQRQLRELDPTIELVLCKQSDSHLRLIIDHPDGVTLALCERVSHQLEELRSSYSLEVSSPGIERPLTKPEHFRRFLGKRARVRTRSAYCEHKSFTGQLIDASDREVTVAADDGVVSIPYGEIRRSNLIADS